MNTIHIICRTGVIALLSVLPQAGGAQTLKDLVPIKASHCALERPPADAGVAATPGGFVMVYPRNAGLSKNYTGCKLMWIVDGDKLRRLATLYFREGQLSIAISHDTRDAAGKPVAACALPQGKDLMPAAGGQATKASCAGAVQDAFYGLQLPTWPRICITDPNAAVCQQDPQ